MFVKSKVAHIQPGSLEYREEGEQFDLEGALYKHVEVFKRPKGKAEEAPEDERPLVTKK